jgi:hypothetical protein
MNYEELADEFNLAVRVKGADLKKLYIEKLKEAIEVEREIAAAIAEEEQIQWEYDPKPVPQHFKHIAHLIRHREEVFKK